MICHTVTLEYRRISFDVIYHHRRQTHPISNSTAGFRFQGICYGSCGRPDYGPTGCMLHAFACKLSGTFSMCHWRWEKAVVCDWKWERIKSECFWWMQILCKRWSGTLFSIFFFFFFIFLMTQIIEPVFTSAFQSFTDQHSSWLGFQTWGLDITRTFPSHLVWTQISTYSPLTCTACALWQEKIHTATHISCTH